MAQSQQRIAVVTGASRGAGRGIAIALGATGATVYVTGRTRVENAADLPGTVQATAEAVTAAGGRGVAVYCDHADDDQVRGLFERIHSEQGRLDILVNNATALHEALTDSGPFWQKPLERGYAFSLCRHLACRAPAAGQPWWTGGEHILLWWAGLYARSSLWGRQGGGRQDGA